MEHGTLTIREISKDLDTCYSEATRSSNIVYDVNEVIRNYVISYDYQNPAGEEKSISNCNKIKETYHPDGADTTPNREKPFIKSYQKKTQLVLNSMKLIKLVITYKFTYLFHISVWTQQR